jgi:hypothetical protein
VSYKDVRDALLRRGSMPVAVVQVGIVRMPMRQRLVAVPVGVRLLDKFAGLVRVLVVLVVHVPVLVLIGPCACTCACRSARCT